MWVRSLCAHGVALPAELELWAALALPAGAGLDVALARRARGGVRRVVGVVQVEKRHHGGVLCAPQRVELQVVRLAQGEIRRARVEQVAHLALVLHALALVSSPARFAF